MVIKALMMSSILSLAVTIAILGWQELFSPEVEAETHLREGTRLLQAGAWAEASQELRLALHALDPSQQVAVQHNLALAYLRMSLEGEGRNALGWAEDAIHHGEEALRLRPGFLDGAWNLELAQKRAQELTQKERNSGSGGAQRLLASFRLQEEATLGSTLQERILGGGLSRPATAMRGPQW